jgi:zinc finger-like protein
MSTPFSGIDGGGAGGVAVMAGPVNPIDPSAPSKTCLKNSALKSPILIFLFFHKAIRSELDGLHRAAIAFATTGGDIKPLLERYYLFRSIYKHHCNAEDEVGLTNFCFRFVDFEALIEFCIPSWFSSVCFFIFQLCIRFCAC